MYRTNRVIPDTDNFFRQTNLVRVDFSCDLICLLKTTGRQVPVLISKFMCKTVFKIVELVKYQEI